MVVHVVGPLGVREENHEPSGHLWSNELDTANCIVDGHTSNSPSYTPTYPLGPQSRNHTDR